MRTRIRLLSFFAILIAQVYVLLFIQLPSSRNVSEQKSVTLRRQAAHMLKRAYSGHNDIVQIVLTCDDSAYALGLLAVLNSTLQNAADPAQIMFRIVTSAETYEAHGLETLIDAHFAHSRTRPNYKVYPLKLSNELDTFKVWAAYRAKSLQRPIVFARFVLSRQFPDLDKLIYLDQDVLVLSDIRELWDVSLDGKPVAMARLCRSEFRRNFNFRQTVLIEGNFDHSECTANNGVMLINLTDWRRNNYEERMLQWARVNSDVKLYELGSQPATNLVFYKNYKILDQRFNLMDLAGLKDAQGLPITVSPMALRNAVIAHWNGAFKPWFGCPGYYSEMWSTYFPDYRAHLKETGDQEEIDSICANVVWTENKHVPSDKAQFTVVIVSFLRKDNLVKIARHLAHSDYVAEIIVAWNNVNESCPDEVLPLARCIQMPQNLVHNRFAIWPSVKTDAVLHYDDDILVPLADLEAAFKVFLSTQNQLLGFEPRVIYQRPDGVHVYRFIMRDGSFDLVIGKLFFVHKKFMKLYMEDPVLTDLSTRAPCEDLAMNFLVSMETHLPPQLFKTNITEIKSKHYAGLSQGIDSTAWRMLRHDCVHELYTIYGSLPLSQRSRFEHNNELDRTVKIKIQPGESICSDYQGTRACRQP